MNDYQLLDFGDGRKLERFGPYVLDRPSPVAEGARPAQPELGTTADARYGVVSGRRSPRQQEGVWDRDLPPWTLRAGRIVMELRLTPFGHVGVFPEQAENWGWIARHVEQSQVAAGRPLKVLNLFAYTGAATLAAAAAGAEVTHIDAARNTVAWARKNAQLSGLGEAPIRWIAEDARKFVARQLRRGNRYDAVILDPPSYGHGVKGEPWMIDEHLPPLLADCVRLTAPRPTFFLLTCHSPGYAAETLTQLLVEAGIASQVEVNTRRLQLTTEDGRSLPCGFAARAPR
jgi:23S rRNA (cytosine1962-C5)-methyltransferase